MGMSVSECHLTSISDRIFLIPRKIHLSEFRNMMFCPDKEQQTLSGFEPSATLFFYARWQHLADGSHRLVSISSCRFDLTIDVGLFIYIDGVDALVLSLQRLAGRPPNCPKEPEIVVLFLSNKKQEIKLRQEREKVYLRAVFESAATSWILSITVIQLFMIQCLKSSI